ncbi:hypothetical protein PROFUN_05878 [Planoprotostelium fungivorum]|uniref:Uncharacterized protein n=1 Tax=Planoprotostelium fungivorum TaxID=1890364 RepID=A0A2P6NKS1_9EUKA|nr:hypothetical protein PROFUN_05878 [Planoprotostelium fungivorum]
MRAPHNRTLCDSSHHLWKPCTYGPWYLHVITFLKHNETAPSVRESQDRGSYPKSPRIGVTAHTSPSTLSPHPLILIPSFHGLYLYLTTDTAAPVYQCGVNRFEPAKSPNLRNRIEFSSPEWESEMVYIAPRNGTLKCVKFDFSTVSNVDDSGKRRREEMGNGKKGAKSISRRHFRRSTGAIWTGHSASCLNRTI